MSDPRGQVELNTFPRLLMHHAQQRPNRPAMREKEYGIWQTYSWAEVAQNVRAIAIDASGADPEGPGLLKMVNPEVISREGEVTLFNGAVDIGQGANTVMVQICADGLGVDIGVIDQIGADTDTTPGAD